MMRKRANPGGFTLPELILVLAVIAVLALLAAPPLGRALSRAELHAAQGSLIHALNTTRSTAVFSGRRAMLCPSRDGQRCSDELHWEGGWLLGHYRSDNPDQIDGRPHVTHAHHPRLTILSTAGRQRIRYQVDGSAGGSNVTFTLCRKGRANDALTVVVSNAGRAYAGSATNDQAQRCADGKL